MARSETVTVLFTDVVGSTAMSSSLDPDAADRVRQDHFSVLRQALAATDGTEVKNLGDGIMAVFASSSAAIACGVAMQQGVDAYNRQSQQRLGLRVGLSGGEVTVEDEDYFGDPVVEAARVCALCDGGQIFMTDAVRFMVGRRCPHPLTALGDRELKGLPEPIALFEVAWEPVVGATAGIPLPDRLDSANSLLFGYFGREQEKTQLIDMVKKATAGSRQVAFVSGEPGIGKTSLCRQVAQHAHSTDVCVLYGRCDEDLGLSYQPFAEALSHLVVNADDGLLTEHVRVHGIVLAGLVPALSTRVPDVAPLQSADPDTERARLFNAVVGLIAAASSDGGALVVLDDLQWADKATLQLLLHVARSGLLNNLMLLGTYRDSELSAGNALSDTLASLRREADVARIDLSGLEDFEIVEMMEAAAGHEMLADGVALAHAVRQETDGNPFFTTEMLVHLSESGLVRQGDDGQWVAAEDLYEQGLPQSVRDVVGQRVDRLGDDVRRVLSQAAVIGRDFDVDLLAAVADIDEEDLLDLLDRATASGLVTDVEGTLDRYTFAHALTQHTLYDDLGASRRARVHRRIAEALETLCAGSPEARAGELAHHFLAATKTADALKALTYSRMAGEQALRQLAPADALGWFTQALELYDQITPDEALRCDLLIGLGTAQRQAGEPAHRETLLRAAAIAKDLQDRELLVRAALANFKNGAGADAGKVDADRAAVLEDALRVVGEGDSSDRALLLATLCAEMTYSPDRVRVSDLATEALDTARRLDDPVTFLRVVNSVYVSVATPDNVEERLIDLADAVSTAAQIGDPAASYHANYNRAVACSQAGKRLEFEGHVDACEVLAEQLGQPVERWSVAGLRSARCLLAGDMGAAEENADAALAIGADFVPEVLAVYGGQLIVIRRHQGRLGEVVDMVAEAAEENSGLPAMRASLAGIYCELDRPDEARAVIEDDIGDLFAQFPYDITWLLSMVMLADVCVDLRDRGPAQFLYDQLLPWHAQMASVGPTGLGPVSLYLGRLAGALEDFEHGEQHFTESLALSRSLRAPYWIALTQIEWVKMLRHRGESDHDPSAESMQTSALDIAEQHGFARLEAIATSLA
jgi:class 3 adenylate cyclase